MDPSLLSAIMHGRRPAPPDFEANVTAALDLLEAAERAAQKERERVLAAADARAGASGSPVAVA